MPYLLIADLVNITNEHGHKESYCFLLHDFNIRAYFSVNFVLCYVLPLASITIIYVKISTAMWRSSKHHIDLEYEDQLRSKSSSFVSIISSIKQRITDPLGRSRSLTFSPSNYSTDCAQVETDSSLQCRDNRTVGKFTMFIGVKLIHAVN